MDRIYRRQGSELLPVNLGGTEQAMEELAAAIARCRQEAVKKTGDTMTGPLAIEGNSGSMIIRSTDPEPYPDMSRYSSLEFHDMDGLAAASIIGAGKTDGEADAWLQAVARKEDGSLVVSNVGAVAMPDGRAWASLNTPPINAYGNHGVTSKWALNHHLRKLVANNKVYVDELAGNDTDDLWERFGNVDKPFRTLQACANFVAQNFAPVGSGGNVEIILLSDITSSSPITIRGIPSLTLRSDGQRRNITCDGLWLHAGKQSLDNVEITSLESTGNAVYITSENAYTRSIFKNCKININGTHGVFLNYSGNAYMQDSEIVGSASKTSHAISCQMNSNIVIGNLTFEGNFNSGVACAYWNGSIELLSACKGSATGRRYRAQYGSRILTNGLGPGALPGDTDGLVDSSSIFA